MKHKTSSYVNQYRQKIKENNPKSENEENTTNLINKGINFDELKDWEEISEIKTEKKENLHNFNNEPDYSFNTSNFTNRADFNNFDQNFDLKSLNIIASKKSFKQNENNKNFEPVLLKKQEIIYEKDENSFDKTKKEGFNVNFEESLDDQEEEEGEKNQFYDDEKELMKRLEEDKNKSVIAANYQKGPIMSRIESAKRKSSPYVVGNSVNNNEVPGLNRANSIHNSSKPLPPSISNAVPVGLIKPEILNNKYTSTINSKANINNYKNNSINKDYQYISNNNNMPSENNIYNKENTQNNYQTNEKEKAKEILNNNNKDIQPISIKTFQQNTNIMHFQPSVTNMPNYYNNYPYVNQMNNMMYPSNGIGTYQSPQSLQSQPHMPQYQINYNQMPYPSSNIPNNILQQQHLQAYQYMYNQQPNLNPMLYNPNPSLYPPQDTSTNPSAMDYPSTTDPTPSSKKLDPKYKPHTFKEYKEKFVNRKEHRGGLGANIGTKEWQEREMKNKRIRTYSKNVKDLNKNNNFSINETRINSSKINTTATKIIIEAKDKKVDEEEGKKIFKQKSEIDEKNDIFSNFDEEDSLMMLDKKIGKIIKIDSNRNNFAKNNIKPIKTNNIDIETKSVAVNNYKPLKTIKLKNNNEKKINPHLKAAEYAKNLIVTNKNIKLRPLSSNKYYNGQSHLNDISNSNLTNQSNFQSHNTSKIGTHQQLINTKTNKLRPISSKINSNNPVSVIQNNNFNVNDDENFEKDNEIEKLLNNRMFYKEKVEKIRKLVYH